MSACFDMKYQYALCSGLLVCLLLFSSISESYGHGLGYEIMPPEMLGSKLVSLEITSDTWPDEYTKEITFSLFETDTGVNVDNVTYFIMLTKQNEVLFDTTGQRDDGTFMLKLHTTESDQITVEEAGSDLIGSLFDETLGKVVNVKGNAFSSGGLYNFKVIITTGDDYSNVLSSPLDYDVGISFLDKTSHSINDINFGQQEFGIITYYDLLNDDFAYEPSKKAIGYSMPFDWSEENILVTSTMHQEIIIPKTFGDLMVESFSATVNGFQVSENVLTIDDFSPENRLVHLVLNQNNLLKISKAIDGFPNKMDFSIMPSGDNLPLTTMTENAQFKLRLSWEPQNIQSGSTAVFFFEVFDAFLIDRQVSVNYDLSIMNNDDMVFQTSGVSNASGHNMIEFDVPDDVTGVITLQFDNLNGSKLADAVFSVVVDRIGVDQIAIPDWIKNNAGWWATDQIDDSAFVQGIQYLIKEGIMIVPPTETSESIGSQVVPAWIKNNAGWWATDQIDDSAFVQGIQYLVQNGIIVI
ncbi:peptidase [Marine Group I thaumarchaeote]|uniref:Peptidase n=1 Tax=Marine Group I thaumarchaeote TaxID=2511932 RepID=A0A7K4NS45_9ARCH|nr:peptidase [Marine Group I thaumarchaeote]